MADVLTPEQRRFNMSRIRDRDTKPELLLRRGLHARGLRFRLQRRDLPGRPDLVFPRSRVVLFVHGCFWHGHECHLFTMPATRTDFWRTKIAANVQRDIRAVDALRQDDWRVVTVWECALRGHQQLGLDTVLGLIQEFVSGKPCLLHIHGMRSPRSDDD